MANLIYSWSGHGPCPDPTPLGDESGPLPSVWAQALSRLVLSPAQASRTKSKPSPLAGVPTSGMEEEKAAAYYDELNRKGEGARRFKQGLGFSSDDPQPASFPSKPSTISSSSSSFLSGFVRAGATPTRPSLPPEAPSRQRRRSRSPSPSRPRPRSRSPSRSRRRRSRSRSRSRERRRRSRSRERGDRRASHHRSRSRSRSPSRRSGRSSHTEGRRERDRHGDRRRDDGGQSRHSSKGRGGTDGGKVDYSRLIEGYDRMVGSIFQLLPRNLILLCNYAAVLFTCGIFGVMSC